eukprot:6308785-Ditylum_brightwellii.AAC.1
MMTPGHYKTDELFIASGTPIDKFIPDNVARYKECINIIKQVIQTKLVFVDEKRPKGADLFNMKGDIIWLYKSAKLIHNWQKNDTAASFLTFIESAVACRWLYMGSFLFLIMQSSLFTLNVKSSQTCSGKQKDLMIIV